MLADGEAGSGAAGLVLMRVALADAGGGCEHRRHRVVAEEELTRVEGSSGGGSQDEQSSRKSSGTAVLAGNKLVRGEVR
jgi:hypothetical protein